MKRSKHKSVIERYEVLEKIISEGNSKLLEPALTKALSDKSPRIRSLAAETIGEKKLNHLLANLLGVINDSDSLTRYYAVESIGKLSPKKEIAFALLNHLHDKDNMVRVAAAEALGAIGNKAVLDKLEKCLLDPFPLVRAYTADSIGRVGTKKSLRILKKYVDKENDDRVKVDFYYGLYLLGEFEYLESLLNLLKSDDLETRCAVADALGSINFDGTDRTRINSLLKKQLDNEATVFARDCVEEALRTFAKGTQK